MKRRPGWQERLRHAANLQPDLSRLLQAYVSASPHILSAGPDPVFEASWRVACFQDYRLAMARVRLPAKTVTLVAVPSDLWGDGARRARILALKRAAVRAGRRVMILPERSLRREPRLGNALLLAQAAQAALGAEDRIAVMAALAEEPGIALGDLAHAVRRGPDRVAAVLSLVKGGIVEVDRRRAIGPLTAVWLRGGHD